MAEKEITLLDVIDRAQLQSLQDAFAKATGMAALATDKSGPVTQLSSPTDFCMNYTRKSSVVAISATLRAASRQAEQVSLRYIIATADLSILHPR